MSSKEELEYKFNSIYPLQVIVNEPPVEDILTPFKNNPLNITTNTATIDEEDTTFLIDMRILFEPEGFDEPFYNIKLRNRFTIKGVDVKKLSKVKKEDDEYYQLFHTLITISYSTSRGYLAALLSNYRYKNTAVLPIIDPKILVTNYQSDDEEQE